MTTAAKHTPGPWAISRMIPDAIGVSSSFENGYAPIYYTPLTEEAEANARLIAAAPDLLAACERIEAIIDGSLGVVGWHRNGDVAEWSEFEEASLIREAIAKAKGGAV